MMVNAAKYTRPNEVHGCRRQGEQKRRTCAHENPSSPQSVVYLMRG